MPFEFRLPDVGEGLAEVEIVEWLVDVGADVREDDPLVEVETDKAVVQLTVPVTGQLVEQRAHPGDRLAVGEVLAVFLGEGDDESDENATSVATSVARGPTSPSSPHAPAEGASASPVSGPPVDGDSPSGMKPRATPSTRGLARELGVDLTTLRGTGPGGRIVDEDVRTAASPSLPATPGMDRDRSSTGSEGGVLEDQVVPMRGVRRAIAEVMTRSWQTVPHVSSIHEVDMGALLDLRQQLKDQGRPLPVTAFMIRAAAAALHDHPELNASVSEDGESMVLHGHVNVGVAVDADDGLIVPVIHDADRKSVARIAEELEDLAAAARSRSVAPARLRGGTFTVNNYGPLGGWFGTSLVKPPEVGILSFGPVRDQVVALDGVPAVRPIAVMNLAADHRVADGRTLIGYCLAVRERLEAPLTLLTEG